MGEMIWNSTSGDDDGHRKEWMTQVAPPDGQERLPENIIAIKKKQQPWQ